MNRTVNVGDRFESNNYGTFEVIATHPRSVYDIRFLNTGTERDSVSLSAIRAGTVRDYSVPNVRSAKVVYPVGSRWESENYGWAEVIEVTDSKTVTIRFDNTSATTTVQGGTLRRGTFTDSSVSIANVPKRYYVYAAYCKGVCVYVGKGKGYRYQHCNSGTSSNFGLNMLFFSGEKIHVEILHDGMSAHDAEQVEKGLLQVFKPMCNVQNISEHRDEFGRYRPDPAKVKFAQTLSEEAV